MTGDDRVPVGLVASVLTIARCTCTSPLPTEFAWLSGVHGCPDCQTYAALTIHPPSTAAGPERPRSHGNSQIPLATKRCGTSSTDRAHSFSMFRQSCGRRGLMKLLKNSFVAWSKKRLHV